MKTNNVLLVIIKIITVLTMLSFFVLTVFSVITNQHLLLTLIGLMLTVGFGYFVHVDIINLLKKSK